MYKHSIRTQLSPQELPAVIIGLMVILGLIMSLLVAYHDAVTAATALSGTQLTLLGIVGVCIVAGLVFVLLRNMKFGGSRLASLSTVFRFVNGKVYILKMALIAAVPTVMLYTNGDAAGTIVGAGITAVSIIIALLIGIPLLNGVADDIANKTGAGGDLEGTQEAQILILLPTIVIAIIVIGALGAFMAVKSRKGKGR